MKAELQRVKFLHPVSPTLTANDVDVKLQPHISFLLDGDVIEVRNSKEGCAVPRAFVPLTNVAFFITKEKPEAKK